MNLSVSYNWLKEYVPTKLSAAEFGAQMSLKGPSVEHLTEVRPQFTNVVVGKILTVKPHPNADKLQLTEVDAGEKIGRLAIVCGAPNIAAGQKVPVALIGAELPGGFKIAKREVRGVLSQGMLCSAKELGFGEDHSGILILADKAIIGAPLEKVLPLNDEILEFEITSNRPDAMSVLGLAREASAILPHKLVYKEPQPNLQAKEVLPLNIKVTEPKWCPRYQAVVMSGIRVTTSPLWLQQRLIASGLRPINNVVDITNYILLEYGQPLHVFDYQKLAGQQIIVRQAKAGEEILALDGQTYQLQENNLVIADAKNPVAVAGVMGGELSAAAIGTTEIVIEAANFNPWSVRKTARTLNLHSESSDLFEKGLNQFNTQPALKRAIELVQQLANGQVASEIFDVQQNPPAIKPINLSLATVEHYLGITLSLAEIKKILTSLGFTVSGGQQALTVTPPWWRTLDMEGEADVIEEIARLYGYHNLPSFTPRGLVPAGVINPELKWEQAVKEALVAQGFAEVYSYSLVSEELIKKGLNKLENCLAVANPLSAEYAYLRPSLLPSLVEVLAKNQENFAAPCVFELANTYQPKSLTELPTEKMFLAAGLLTSDGVTGFYWLKGVLENLLNTLGLTAQWRPVVAEGWHPERTAQIVVLDKIIGKLGELHPAWQQNYSLKNRVVAWEIDYELLASLATEVRAYQDLPKYPAITLDISFLVDERQAWQQIVDCLQKLNTLIVQVSLLDVFTGANIPAGKKSLTIRLVYRHFERTLKAEEVEAVQEKVVHTLASQFAAELRHN